MEKIRILLCIRKMDRVPNARIRELYGVEKEVDERNEEDFIYRFSHVERMENDMIIKRVFVEECASSRSGSQPRKKEVD